MSAEICRVQNYFKYDLGQKVVEIRDHTDSLENDVKYYKDMLDNARSLDEDERIRITAIANDEIERCQNNITLNKNKIRKLEIELYDTKRCKIINEQHHLNKMPAISETQIMKYNESNINDSFRQDMKSFMDVFNFNLIPAEIITILENEVDCESHMRYKNFYDFVKDMINFCNTNLVNLEMLSYNFDLSDLSESNYLSAKIAILNKYNKISTKIKNVKSLSDKLFSVMLHLLYTLIHTLNDYDVYYESKNGKLIHKRARYANVEKSDILYYNLSIPNLYATYEESFNQFFLDYGNYRYCNPDLLKDETYKLVDRYLRLYSRLDSDHIEFVKDINEESIKNKIEQIVFDINEIGTKLVIDFEIIKLQIEKLRSNQKDKKISNIKVMSSNLMIENRVVEAVSLDKIIEKYVKDNNDKLRKGQSTNEVLEEIKNLMPIDVSDKKIYDKKIYDEMKKYCNKPRIMKNGVRTYYFVLIDDEIIESEEEDNAKFLNLTDVVMDYVDKNKEDLEDGIVTSEVLESIKFKVCDTLNDKIIREEINKYCITKRMMICGVRNYYYVLKK